MQRARHPHHEPVTREDLPRVRRILIDRDHLGIIQQRQGPRIHAREVAPDHQRRAGDAPERHVGTLLGMRQASPPRRAPSRGRRQVADRQHVGVRPVAGAGQRCPARQARKLAAHALRIGLAAVPEIPHVVGNPPHVRVAAQLSERGKGRGSRRETEHHRPARGAHCARKHADFGAGVWMAGNAIRLDEIDMPGGVQARDGVVVGLAGGIGGHTVVVGVPGTGRIGRRGLAGAVGGAGDRQILPNGLPGDAAQDVDAEPEP